jgi:formylglycine-generating enzyme required for sulfatase activity
VKAATAKPTTGNIRAQLKSLLEKVTKRDVVLIALAGHGVQFTVRIAGKDRDENFFCPCDTKVRDSKDLAELSKTMIPLRELFKDLDDSGAGAKLLLVDACRNDPREGRNLDVDTLPRPAKGTAALFSCKSGERAFETPKLGTKGHGVFFFHVLEGLRGKAKDEDGEVTWDHLIAYVRGRVSRQVPTLIGEGARQTPHLLSNLEGDPVLLRPSKEVIQDDWGKEVTNSIGMKLVRIPAGKFWMGSTRKEQDAAIAAVPEKHRDGWARSYRSESPRHEVVITKAFYLGACTVTQRQYERVVGSNPSWFSPTGGGKDEVKGVDTSDFPVGWVNWEDATAFCAKLTLLEKERAAGRAYRLPTEAEWEYACRAGTTTPYSCGATLSTSQANFDYKPGRPCEVGSYDPNRWELYDMHGNSWQWCADRFDRGYYRESPKRDPQGPEDGSLRVLRGGCCYDYAASCRAAVRTGNDPRRRSREFTFRVVCVPADSR